MNDPEPAQRPGNPLGDLAHPVRWRMRLGSLLAVLGSLCGLAPYLAIADLAAQVVSAEPLQAERVWMSAGIVAVGLVGRSALMAWALGVTHIADAHLQAIIARRLADHLGRLPLGWFGARSSGLVRKTIQNDVHDLHYLVAHAQVETIAAVVLPVGGLAYLVVLDWRIALLAIVTLPFYLVAFSAMMRGAGDKMRFMNEALGKVSAALVEFVSGIAVIKAYHRGERGAPKAYTDAADEFGAFYSGWVATMLRLEALATLALTAPVVLLANLIGVTAMVSAGWIDLVAGITGAMIAVTIPGLLQYISFGAAARREAAAAAGRILDVLGTPVVPEPERPQRPEGHEVVFEGAAFSYGPGHPVLRGIDLRCAAGTVTAVVGPSGAGKSTLVELVARFWDVESGAVRIGGVDVRDIAAADLYRSVAFVLQDVSLLHGTVRENIVLGRPDATEEELVAAATSARIHERILALPQGYDTVLGAGVHLSGGESQRIAIARALLHDAPVLLLDEATAFADPESEAEIQLALSSLIAGRTVIVVAHRLHTVVAADEIVVLEEGRIAQQGRHEELIAVDGRYRRLWLAQDLPLPATDEEVPA